MGLGIDKVIAQQCHRDKSVQPCGSGYRRWGTTPDGGRSCARSLSGCRCPPFSRLADRDEGHGMEPPQLPVGVRPNVGEDGPKARPKRRGLLGTSLADQTSFLCATSLALGSRASNTNLVTIFGS